MAGYGFFGGFTALSLDEAWKFFEWKNGDRDLLYFLGGYRKLDLIDRQTPRAKLGYTILRDARGVGLSLSKDADDLLLGIAFPLHGVSFVLVGSSCSGWTGFMDHVVTTASVQGTCGKTTASP